MKTKKMFKLYLKTFIMFLCFVFFSLILFSISSSANNYFYHKNWEKIEVLNKSSKVKYVEFVSNDIEDFYNPVKGVKYPSINLFDGSFRTCWVCGSDKNYKDNYLYIVVSEEIPLDKLILNIFSGYGKSKKLYFANSRPTKIKISIYAGFNPDGFVSEVAKMYIAKNLNYSKVIDLKDIYGIQSIPLSIDSKKIFNLQKEAIKESIEYEEFEFKIIDKKETKKSIILKIEVLDIVKGSKYNDVCISEIFFNNRFISSKYTYIDLQDLNKDKDSEKESKTSNKDKNLNSKNLNNNNLNSNNLNDKIKFKGKLDINKVSGFEVKNNDSIFIKLENNTDLLFFKDKDITITYVQWIENKWWLLIFYVPNDECGSNSRVEEKRILIDLKNLIIANDLFKQCTGKYLINLFLDTDENNNIFIQVDDMNIYLNN